MPQTTLDGLRVIITRPVEQGAQTAQAVANAGGVPVLLPMVRILPAEDLSSCDAALRDMTSTDGVVFASVNGVHAFFGRARTLGIDDAAWQGTRFYAVGAKTARCVQEYGATVSAVPELFSGQALGDMLGQHDLRGKRFLFPRGTKGRDDVAEAVTAAGGTAVRVIVYQTVGPDDATAHAMRIEMLGGDRSVVFLASPSAVEHFDLLFSPAEKAMFVPRTVFAVIGPTTEEATRKCGLPVHVRAAESTERGLLEALMRYLSGREHPV
jgi:uroporphyrinogen-III synthase